jgi:hypothetical protein
MSFVKKDLPVVIVFVTGVIMIVGYFVRAPEIFLEDVVRDLSVLASIIAGYATILGISTLSLVHINHVVKRRKGQWIYSIILLALTAIMIAVGLVGPIGTHPYFMWFYRFPLTALDTTTYSILAFYIASAAFRAFKIRSWETFILGLAGIIVMLMNAPVGAAIWSGFPEIGKWIMNVPNASAFRGFIIGSSVGAIAIGLRVLIGKERGVLGRA